jgi:hypothetical protein
MLGSSWVAAQLAASQERLNFMKLIFLDNGYCDIASDSDYIQVAKGQLFCLSVMKHLQYVIIFVLVRFAEVQDPCKKNTFI